MANVKLGEKIYDIPALRCAGDDALVEELERISRILDPWDWALDAAEAANVEVPPPGPKRAEILAPRSRGGGRRSARRRRRGRSPTFRA